MLKITIAGPQGSGKTIVENIVAHALENAGFAVTVFDEEGQRIASTASHRAEHHVEVRTVQDMSGDDEMKEILAQNFHTLKDDLDGLLRRRQAGR